MSTWSSKKECRSYFKSLCAQEFAQGLVQNQQQLNLILSDFMSRQNGVWGAYRALSQEASVDEVLKLSRLTWVFPRVHGEDLKFYLAQDFAPGYFGIHEPHEKSTQVELPQMQGLLVPGLVFNKNGNRLGKGKGFYDRTLANFQGLKVGVCFEFQISQQPLPTEKHDIQMDYLICESELIDCRS